MIMRTSLLGLAALGFVAVTPATAAPLTVSGPNIETGSVELVQHNRRHQMRQWRRQRDGRNWRRRNHRQYGSGFNAGELIVGTIAGAIIANAIRGGYARDTDMEACQDRYRSFDPRTGTYIGYDGNTYVCPYLQ